MSVQQEKFKAIADRIRHYLGINDLIKPSDFADKIDAVAEDRYTLGVTDCYPRAYDEGKSAGISEGIEEGKQSAYDEFWDNIQNDGNRVYYSGAFAEFKNADNFFPKYNITAKGLGVHIFLNFNKNNTPIDMAKRLSDCGVTLDVSNVTTTDFMFSSNGISRVPVISTVKANNLTELFSASNNLKTIDKLILRQDGTQSFSSTFYNCTNLENIVVEGVIGQNFNMQHSPLNKASIESVIGCLSTTATGQTLTLKKTAKEAAFTAEEWATLTATKTNWTISLV